MASSLAGASYTDYLKEKMEVASLEVCVIHGVSLETHLRDLCLSFVMGNDGEIDDYGASVIIDEFKILLR